jgi:hypothetical protein
MPSARYATFETRVFYLEHLLPATNPSGYTAEEQDLIKGYCLLVHAEIEAYIEDILLQETNNAVTAWRADMEAITPLIFNLSLSAEKKDLPATMVHSAFSKLRNSVTKNHGIKENNLTPLFRTIGFTIDASLQTLLNSFGSNRGAIAHSSFHTVVLLDPVTEKNSVHLILQELRTFDNDLIVYTTTGSKKRIPLFKQPFIITFLCKNKYLRRLILKHL